jgi:polysaccharide export outer membrane protein
MSKTAMGHTRRSIMKAGLRRILESNGCMIVRAAVPLICILACCDIRAQERRQALPEFRPPAQTNSDPGPASTMVLIAPDEDYRIGPGDVIDVRVEDAPELSRVLRVSANGTFSLPYVGRVTAQQKTAEELAESIAARLRGSYLVEPNVTITVKQINSHAFFIQGAVRRPGVYQIEGRPSLLKLVTIAGGLADNHGSTAYIIREVKAQRPDASAGADSTASVAPARETGAESGKGAPAARVAPETESEPQYELTKVNITGLLKGRFEQNMTVEPGSIVNIPPTDVFFVAGEVKGPGSFPLKDGTTLRQAISLAQGTTYEADKSNAIIFRENLASGQRQEIKVDIGKVMSGKSDDVPIMANDIIIVPNSRLKTVSGALLSAFGLSAVRLPGRY